MKKHGILSILFITIFCTTVQSGAHPMTLWYTKPAARWEEALCVGNGRLGGMIFGRTEHERIQLNEDTVWSGGPYDPNNPEALSVLPELTKLIFSGKQREAEVLAQKKFMATPLRQQTYMTLGDLTLNFPGHKDVSNYRRSLNIDEAVARVAYRVDGTTYMREIFSSPVDQALVIRVTADAPGKISFTAEINTMQKIKTLSKENADVVLDGITGDYQNIK